MIDARRAIVVAALMLPLAPASADTATEQELRNLLEQQEQRIKVLERKLEIQDENAKATVAATPVVKASPKGMSFQSADGSNLIKFRGLLHVDGATFLDDADLKGINGWSLNRVRPILEGTFGGMYDWRFTTDFGRGKTVVQDAYVTGRFDPRFALTAGKFKAPGGLERLQSASDIRFVQRAFPTSLVPNRDIGIQASGSLLPDRVEYQVAYLNGSNDGGSSETFSTPDTDPNSGKDWALRVFSTPFANSSVFGLRGFGIGLAGTTAEQTGDSNNSLLPSIKSPGQQTVFKYRSGVIADGDRQRITPQLYYYRGSFGLIGEWVQVEQDVTFVNDSGTRHDTVDTDAWQLAMSWFVTGEQNSFRGYTPLTTFTRHAPGWGALELKARYDEFNVDDAAFAGGSNSFADPTVSVHKASAYALGFNWYLSQNIKWMFDYEHTKFEGGSALGNGDLGDEEVLFGRVQLGF
jgi:phosphate-selective porin OprO/OprP